MRRGRAAADVPGADRAARRARVGGRRRRDDRTGGAPGPAPDAGAGARHGRRARRPQGLLHRAREHARGVAGHPGDRLRALGRAPARGTDRDEPRVRRGLRVPGDGPPGLADAALDGPAGRPGGRRLVGERLVARRDRPGREPRARRDAGRLGERRERQLGERGRRHPRPRRTARSTEARALPSARRRRRGRARPGPGSPRVRASRPPASRVSGGRGRRRCRRSCG